MPKYTKDNLPPVVGPRGDLDGEDLPDPLEEWGTQICDEPFECRRARQWRRAWRAAVDRWAALAPANRGWLSIPEIAEDLARLAGSMVIDEPSRAQGERLLIDALRQHAFDRGGHARVRLRTSERAMRWFSPGDLAVAEEVFREDPVLFKKQYLNQLYIRRDVLADWLRFRGVRWLAAWGAEPSARQPQAADTDTPPAIPASEQARGAEEGAPAPQAEGEDTGTGVASGAMIREAIRAVYDNAAKNCAKAPNVRELRIPVQKILRECGHYASGNQIMTIAEELEFKRQRRSPGATLRSEKLAALKGGGS